MPYSSPYESQGPYGGYSSYPDSWNALYSFMPSDYGDAVGPLTSPTAPTSSPSSSKNRREEQVSYFVPGFGISRHVILSCYQRYVGPSATIRPFSYQQREGYMVTNIGKPMTQSQIEDLKRLSEEYETKEAMRMTSRSGSISADKVFINQPVPVQQRRYYTPDGPYGSR